MTLIELDESPSTNTYLASIAADAPHGTVVSARRQTAGRGQRGNSWESAPGENITMSVLLRPGGLHPSRQFVISQAVSLAITGVLRGYMPGSDVRVKWPNDIYVDDRKICGILIENVITSAAINHSVVGIGINVNQRRFFSDAPNPVSMAQLTDRSFDLGQLTREFCRAILEEVDTALAAELSGEGTDALAGRYFASLWRSDGFYPYRDNMRGEMIEARIAAVAPDGLLTLELRGGERRTFAFKEVSAAVKESLL